MKAKYTVDVAKLSPLENRGIDKTRSVIRVDTFERQWFFWSKQSTFYYPNLALARVHERHYKRYGRHPDFRDESNLHNWRVRKHRLGGYFGECSCGLRKDAPQGDLSSLASLLFSLRLHKRTTQTLAQLQNCQRRRQDRQSSPT